MNIISNSGNKMKKTQRRTKEVIFNVFIRCLAEYQAGRLLSELDDVYQRVADMTGKSVSCIRRIANEGEQNDGIFDKPPKAKTGRPRKEIDSFDLCAIRQKVLTFYAVKKQVPTLRSLLPVVQEELGFDGSREHLRHILLALGFTYKKRQNNQSVLIEKPSIAAKRERYLREIIANRNLPKDLQKNIIYLDESYMHSSYKLEKCWEVAGLSKVKRNYSKDKRYIILIAGSIKGFVPNALLICSGTKKEEDYHADMDPYNFVKWVKENVMPNVSEPSIIVMDNAPYHSVVSNKAPTTGTKIQDIKLWLLENNVKFDPTLSKPELLMLVKQNKKEPIYEIDEILGEHGHTVVRVPPYHCDLNPVELIWATAKHKMFTIDEESSDIVEVAKQAFQSITVEDWKNSCQQVIDIENEYYERGHTLYDEIDKLVKNFADNSSSSSSDDDSSNNDTT